MHRPCGQSPVLQNKYITKIQSSQLRLSGDVLYVNLRLCLRQTKQNKATFLIIYGISSYFWDGSQEIIYCQVQWCIAFNPSIWEAEAGWYLSSRSARSTEWALRKDKATWRNAALKNKTKQIICHLGILGYCLLPNHLLVLEYQRTGDEVTNVISSITQLSMGISSNYLHVSSS